MSPNKRHESRRGYGTKRSLVATIAAERIRILLDQARSKAREENGARLARRYVELARKISMRTKVRIPREDKRFICKSCLMPLIPGHNARIRLTPEKRNLTITCLSCLAMKRYPYTREKARKR